jgi:serine/threonine protein kinase
VSKLDRDDQHAGQTDTAAALDAPNILAPGAIIDNRFEIISRLGTGGMSTVYKSRQLILDRPVALKILHERLVIDEGAVERFHREAQASTLLEHPNIVRVYGFGSTGKQPYIAEEYLEGVSLAELLKQEKRLSKERALPIFKQILKALAHAHVTGIIHRDLKPSNIVLVGCGSEPLVKLVDFGIAKILPQSGKELEKLTQSGSLPGTIDYMSPEQCLSAPLDPRSDLYSMGCLMYEVLDGKPPLQGMTPYATVAAHLHESPRKSKFLADDCGRVVLKALEKDPGQRPQSAAELEAALDNPAAYMQARSVQNKTGKKRVGTWIAGTGTAAAAVLLSLGIIFVSSKQRSPLSQPISRVQASNEAEEHRLEREIAINEHKLNTKGLGLADSLDNLSRSYLRHGKLAEVEPLLLRSLAIKEKALGREHPSVADTLSRLVYTYTAQQKLPAAEALAKRALFIREKAFHPDHPDVADSLNALAQIYTLKSDYPEAERLAKLSLEKRKKQLGADHNDVAASLATLGNIYFVQHRYSDAESPLKQALSIREKSFALNSSAVADSLTRLATLYKAQGRDSEAEPLLRRAREIVESGR